MGVDRTGFPAIVTMPRIWPSPGVSISSPSTATGNSPPNSGSPRTRECHRAGPPVLHGSTASTAGVVNIAPPARSRLPVNTFSTSRSQVDTAPNAWVEVPMRP